MKKSIFASWTIWFGIAQILYGIIGGLSGNLDSSTAFTLITTGLGTIGLRFKTSTPIA